MLSIADHPNGPQGVRTPASRECQGKSESRIGIPALQEQAQRCAVETFTDFVWKQIEKQVNIDLLGRILLNFDRNYDNVRMYDAY